MRDNVRPTWWKENRVYMG
jgi:hypothetical protein